MGRRARSWTVPSVGTIETRREINPMTSNIAVNRIGHPDVQGTPRKVSLATIAGAAYIGTLAVAVTYLVINGPAMRKVAERSSAAQIEQENTAFCQRFGMARGTDSFEACASALAEIRKRHGERITRELVDFFRSEETSVG